MTITEVALLEQGTRWPAYLEEEVSQDSAVAILAQQADESLDAFVHRAVGRLSEIETVLVPVRGTFVSRCTGGTRSIAARHRLLIALARAVERSGGQRILLIAEGSHAESRALAGAVREINAELSRRDSTVTIQLRIAEKDADASASRVPGRAAIRAA
jgi:hypothetical protein